MSINNLWLKLSNKDIGFYTHETKHNIPNIGGVYSWILPTKFNPRIDDSLVNSLKKIKKIQAYDSNIEKFSELTETFSFNWDPYDVTLKKNDGDQNLSQSFLDTLESMDDENIGIFKRAILLGSIFSRPLYIGYTNNLARRYHQHVTGSGSGSNFHNRFNKYLSDLIEKEKLNETNRNNSNIYNFKIEDLLFVSLNFEKSDLKDNELKLIEEVLKILANPIFSKI